MISDCHKILVWATSVLSFGVCGHSLYAFTDIMMFETSMRVMTPDQNLRMNRPPDDNIAYNQGVMCPCKSTNCMMLILHM